jgi:hypothetical protein
MNKAELLAQIDAMTEEEAAEVKLIYEPEWPDKATPIEEVRMDDAAELPEAWKRFDDGTPQPDWVALLREAREGR